jgi:plasmid maintenance system antidote protein VapI
MQKNKEARFLSDKVYHPSDEDIKRLKQEMEASRKMMSKLIEDMTRITVQDLMIRIY